MINLESIALAQSSIDLFPTVANCSIPYNPTFRTAIGFLTFLGVGTNAHLAYRIERILVSTLAIIQYLAYTLIYQRLFEDKIVNFIDLCSVANISVFILDQNTHGYYIHGRSPHGLTDVNMKEVLMNLYREESGTSSTRGLQDNSDEQIFIMKINRSFRQQYEALFQNYLVSRSDTLVNKHIQMPGSRCSFVELHRRSANPRGERTLHDHAASIVPDSQWISGCVHQSVTRRTPVLRSESLLSREDFRLRISSSCLVDGDQSRG